MIIRYTLLKWFLKTPPGKKLSSWAIGQRSKDMQPIVETEEDYILDDSIVWHAALNAMRNEIPPTPVAPLSLNKAVRTVEHRLLERNMSSLVTSKDQRPFDALVEAVIRTSTPATHWCVVTFQGRLGTYSAIIAYGNIRIISRE